MQEKEGREAKTVSSGTSTVRSNVADVVRAGGAPPAAAAAYVFGIVYLWTEAVVRYLATNTSLGGWYSIYSLRTGDVVAIWLTEVVVGLLISMAVYALLRKRTRVSSIQVWTVVLVVSAIVAPLIGEIGTAFGI